jgi:hypothetical protein
MKAIDIITRLQRLDPNTEVTGVEHLRVNTSLMTAPVPPKKRKYLKPDEREACAREKGDVKVIAAKYGVHPTTVMGLRKEYQTVDQGFDTLFK